MHLPLLLLLLLLVRFVIDSTRNDNKAARDADDDEEEEERKENETEDRQRQRATTILVSSYHSPVLLPISVTRFSGRVRSRISVSPRLTCLVRTAAGRCVYLDSPLDEDLSHKVTKKTSKTELGSQARPGQAKRRERQNRKRKAERKKAKKFFLLSFLASRKAESSRREVCYCKITLCTEKSEAWRPMNVDLDETANVLVCILDPCCS